MSHGSYPAFVLLNASSVSQIVARQFYQPKHWGDETYSIPPQPTLGGYIPCIPPIIASPDHLLSVVMLFTYLLNK
jgi:hypothetical protein